jgi:excinuclease ABC subunit C
VGPAHAVGFGPWNRSPSGGQESEVWIRLSDAARTPGVTVVHEPSPGDPSRYFGPYLGGQKVRDAVSGLSRVLPLGYAADGAAGTKRDLARGVSPGARGGLAAAVTAVLSREPGAVAAACSELTARRDAATAGLAFELAGRLQAELEALDWITGEQKVTQARSYDLDVSGWADGVLVSFEVRGGRLSGWRHRDCGEAAACPHLARTPPEWREFGRRSADLAARLR